jgi:hypothetical protein
LVEDKLLGKPIAKSQFSTMSDSPILINCKKCGESFAPDFKTCGDWICPKCQCKNPNLKRHYRSVADLYILWFVFSVVVLWMYIGSTGFNFGAVVRIPFVILLLVTIITIYKSKTPWTDKTAKILIWSSFGVSVMFKAIQTVQLLLADKLTIPFLLGFGIVHIAIFIYLFWLHCQSKKYSGNS